MAIGPGIRRRLGPWGLVEFHLFCSVVVDVDFGIFSLHKIIKYFLLLLKINFLCSGLPLWRILTPLCTFEILLLSTPLFLGVDLWQFEDIM